MATESTELPSIFDSTGAFAPLSQDVLDQMSDEQVAAYQKVATAYAAVGEIDRKIESVTRELHETVAELRSLETLAAKHKPSQMDCIREAIETGRRYG
jgi:hypothetical protein